MIKKNDKEIVGVFKGTTEISAIYKGLTLVYQNAKIMIAEGVPPLTVLNALAKVLLGYRVYGDTTQNGTPTPDNPIEIQSVGDKTKNLFDKSTYTARSYYINNASTGTEGVYIKGTPSIIKTLRFVPKKNTTYTVSKTSGQIFMVSASINEANANVSAKCLIRNNNATSLTFNSGEYNYIEIAFWRSIDTITYEKMLDSIQIEEGSTATSYEPYGYRIPIKKASSNLLPYPYIIGSQTYGGIEVTINDDGSIKLNGTSTGLNTTINTFRLKAGTYTISGNPSPNANLWLRVVGSSTSAYYVRNYNGIKGTLTIAEDSDMYVYITISNGVTLDNVTIYPMVNEGIMDLEYSKYFTPETTNIYLDEPLRKIGDFADYIDFETQKVYRNVKKINLSTTLPQFAFSTSWDNDDYTTCYFYTADKVITFYPISNYFKSSKGYNANVHDNVISTNIGNNYIYIKIAKTIATSKTELDNWLNTLSTPVEIIYQLASTTEESIELPDILLNKGTNVVDVETSLTPSNLWVKYKGKE